MANVEEATQHHRTLYEAMSVVKYRTRYEAITGNSDILNAPRAPYLP